MTTALGKTLAGLGQRAADFGQRANIAGKTGKAYDELANFGRATTTIGAYFVYALAVGCALSGLYCIFSIGKTVPATTADKKDPNAPKEIGPRGAGLIMLCLAAFSVVFAWTNSRLSRKYKWYAASSGASLIGQTGRAMF